MKQLVKLFAVLTLTLLCNGLAAQDTKHATKEISDWRFIDVGFFPGIPNGTRTSNTSGLKLGLPMVTGHGHVYGLEASLFYSGTDNIRGMQASFITSITEKIDGFQASLVNVATDKSYGCQASVVNVATHYDGFQCGVVNVTSDTLDGNQLGVFNYSDHKGCQLGLINIIKDGFLPFMIVFNISF